MENLNSYQFTTLSDISNLSFLFNLVCTTCTLNFAIIFALLGVCIGQAKGILGGGGIYIVLTVINKVLEKGFSKNSWGDMLISKTVKWVWKCYSNIIRNGLFDFEKDLEKDIMRACIENDNLLLKYQQYCI